MKVLIGCEYSGRVREAFRKLGHEAWSCDLLPSEDNSPFHLQIDVLSLLDKGWDLAIFHPPCTYLTIAAEWAYKDCQNKNIKEGTLIGAERRLAREDSIKFVMQLANSPIQRIAIENPIGVLSSRWRKPDQIIQPYQYGDDASKRTCLWLKGLPHLQPTDYVEPRIIRGKPRWANQTDSGQNKAAPSPDRWKERSRTYQGIANAMANQWSV